ncbi:MAG: nucleotidyltransferase substrate binding protein [Bacteriovoracaceae bacterium]|nr:nucleotidyltransferase substrate binding protein [Bacteriovoracaceae bacterium]
MTINPLKNALETLKKGYKEKPNELERDGLIQRFEYCLELCWKSAKKVLLEKGIQVDVPKNVIRELANIGWINTPEKWLDFIDKRNKASHIYHEKIAEEIFAIIPSFMNEAALLYKVLEKNLK